MVKKILLALMIMSVGAGITEAQITMKGMLNDRVTGEAMGYVSVALDKGGKIVKGAMSDETGVFKFEDLSAGVYTIRATMMGYQEAIKNVNLTGKSIQVNVGTILMDEDAKMLNEVEIVAQQDQAHFDIDKKVFSVDQSIAAAGGDASEVLQGIPSVEVDNDGEISLRNNSNVEIWINGKPSGLTEDNRAQILEQMPAESIDRVEIITNPSAKYSPEGSAGVINLVLKRDRKAGFYGSVNAGLSHSVHSDRVGERAGANINFNVGRWDGYANIGFRNDYRGSDTKTDRYYLGSSGDTTSILNQNTWDRTRRTSLTGRVGLNYRINDVNTVGVAGYMMGRNQGYESEMDYMRHGTAATTAYGRDVEGDRNPLSGNVTLDHQWKFDDKESMWQTSMQYSKFRNDRNYNYVQTGFAPSDQNQINVDDNVTYELKSDVTKKWRLHTLEAGVNVRYQERESDSRVEDYNGTSYVRNPLLDNDYIYKEQLYAAYATWGSRIRNFSYQVGLRGEYIVIDNSSNGVANKQKSYFEPFPTVFLSYALPRSNEIQLNYTKRINRPRGGRLNSYHDISDSTNVKFGNPDLLPEYVNAVELNYIKSWENHTFSASAYYHFTDDVIRSFQFMDVDSVLNTTYMNVTREDRAGLELVSKNTIARWFNLTTTVNLYYQHIAASDFVVDPTFSGVTPLDANVHIDGDEDFSWSAKMLGNFMMTKTFTGQLTASYRSGQVVAQGRSDGFFTLDLGLRKSFWEKRLNLAFTVRDILNSRKRVTDTETDNFRQHYERVPFGPSLRLTATYNFGNTKKKAKRGGEEREEESVMDEGMEEF